MPKTYTIPVVKDSFGNEVNVGDFVYFQVKTRYAGALSLGRIIKITPTGGVSLVSLCTGGKTLDEYVAHQKETHARAAKSYTDRGMPVPDWVGKYEAITGKTRLADASSCVLIPNHVLPPMLTQALSNDPA